MNLETLLSELRGLVASDDSEMALTQLRDFLLGQRSQRLNDAILLLSRLSRIRKEEAWGTLSSTDARVERNRINRSLGTLLEDLEAHSAELTMPAARLPLDGPVSVAPDARLEKSPAPLAT